MRDAYQPRQHAETGPQSQDALCPLHVAMQGLAHAGVSQLLYYAQGEYAPRAGLMEDLDRWQQLHRLIAAHICPASRTERATAAAVTIACGLIPESCFSAQRDLLRRCACRERGDPCPLEGEAELHPLSTLTTKAGNHALRRT
jgi:hypothetical protein